MLGLDVGGSKIGVAETSEDWRARPLVTVPRRVDDIKRLIDDRRIGLLAVGWPLEMSGVAGDRCADVLDFLKDLRQEGIHTAAALCDERLTTQAARQRLRSAGVRRSKQARLEDQLAAAAILDILLGREDEEEENEDPRTIRLM